MDLALIFGHWKATHSHGFGIWYIQKQLIHMDSEGFAVKALEWHFGRTAPGFIGPDLSGQRWSDISSSTIAILSRFVRTAL